MSDFSLNTNLNAMAALYYLNQTNSALNQSIQRLSSGLRINTPADDPSGFVIANSLQSQVDGYNQAISNTQGAANEMKTATGALAQIDTLIQNIKASALDALNTPANAATDQQAIQTAITAINNIANNTTYGAQNLLNGSAGVTANITNSTVAGGAYFSSTFAGNPITSGNVTMTVLNAATAAQVNGTATYATVNANISTVNGGSSGTGGTIVINGQSINVTGSETVQTLINQINNISNVTGVTAQFNSGNGSGVIQLVQDTYGANYKISESESGNLITNGAGANVAGLNATVSVSVSDSSSGTVSTQTVLFSGGRDASDSGLQVSDQYGNSILLTPAGNSTSTVNASVANITAGSVTFQLGSNVGQTASVAFNSAVASALGTNVVPGQSLASIDVTTPTGAQNAVNIANAAATQITNQSAQLGAFQTDVLTATQNYLQSAVTNLTASISSIASVNVAQESVNLANLQLLQQQGTAALYTAQNLNSVYLKLLP